MAKFTGSQHELHSLQKRTFHFLWTESNPENGLIVDNTKHLAPSSIAAVGLALTAYPVAVERRFITRQQAIKRTLATLRFFKHSRQSEEPDATGYKGFYYHFLDMESGRRVWNCELSTIDTTILLAGMLTAAAYFDRDNSNEREIRETADLLYHRADWQWAFNGGPTVSHGWRPEKGFIRHRWQGFNEALILYVLGLASPTYPLPGSSYEAWTSTYQWKKLYGFKYLYAGPLFTHQLSHCWIDFRGIQDKFLRARNIDYFENSRRATYIQQQYAIRNPKNFKGYEKDCWGITASDGPGPARRKINGRVITFFDYKGRGVPYGPDDGTLAPWAVIASLPFAPEIVLPAIRGLFETYPKLFSHYGFRCSFNPTFPSRDSVISGWHSQGHYGLDQGPIVLMIENYRSGLIWRLLRDTPIIRKGLIRAGFSGGWL